MQQRKKQQPRQPLHELKDEEEQEILLEVIWEEYPKLKRTQWEQLMQQQVMEAGDYNGTENS